MSKRQRGPAPSGKQSASNALLDRVARLAEDFSRSTSSRMLPRKLMAAVAELLPASSAMLGIYDEAEGVLRVEATSQALHGVGRECYAAADVRKHLTLRRREPRLVTQFGKLGPFAPLAASTQALLLLPVHAMREEVGLLWVELLDPNVLSTDRLALLRLLVSQFMAAHRNLTLLDRAGYLEAYLKGLIEHTNAAILVLDSHRRVKMANGVIEALVGLSHEELLGADFFDFLVVDERYAEWKAAFELALSGEAVNGEPIDILSHEGVVRNLIINATRVPAGQRGEEDVLFVGLDVTETAELRRGILQSQKLASLGEMAAGIAHEFNSPLTVVNSAAELLLRGAERLGLPSEELKRPATFLRDSMSRIEGLARNLLSYARPGSREPVERLDLNQEIERALSFTQYELSRDGVKVETSLAASLPSVKGNPGELQQVLVNLLVNARQALAGKPGRIAIQTLANGTGWVDLEVHDSGPGISEKVRSQIFEPFFTTKREGSGLGLYLVRNIIERHGGTIEVECPGEGTRFRVRLPAVS